MVKRRLMAKRQQLSNKFSLKKCSERDCTAEDRISKLPDEILVHILSFLSVKEAADTSVLSKRWLPLWTYIYRLDFNATKPLNEVALNPKLLKMHMKKYIRWVNRTLQMCKVERLDQFRVCFDLNKFAHHEIDRWLEFAVSRQVQRLMLDLLKGGEVTRYSPHCYNFPAQHFGLNDYAAQPRLSYVHKLPPLLRNFKSLKVLLFNSVNVTGEVLEFFLYNCPYLEEMTVHGSGTLVNLEVVGPSLKLKHLSIFYCTEVESLKICDTNLVTLATSSSHKLLLLNVPMLIEVEILGRATHFLDDILPIVSCVLSQLEVLKIHADDGLEYLGKYKIPQLTMLKKFVLVLQAWDDTSFLDCTNVIEAAPQLTEFELNLLWIKPKRSKRECRKVVSCPLHHLKVLSLYGYYGRTSEVELVRYFLKNAIVLQKIIVDPLQRRDFHYKGYPKEDKHVRIARKYAKLQLQTQVPSHIELVIL